MSIDNLLIAIIIAGIGLSGACLCAKYREWRRDLDAEKRQAVSFREMHVHHMGLEECDMRASRGGGQQKVVATKSTTIPGMIAETHARSSTYKPHHTENTE
jgi:hypothetical protein